MLPSEGVLAETIRIQMAPGTTVTAQLQNPGGAPLPRQTVGMMLLHGTHGPWWPAEATTDDAGNIQFGPVPAGAFVVKFKAESGGTLEVPETFFPPGGVVSLGTLRLQ